MELKPHENSLRKHIKILAVDDREDNLFSIETILEQEDYQIVKANSGRAALKILLQQQDFTLILMDVQMPDMNGFETAALIYEREKLRHIPIIFITAHNQGEEKMYEGYKRGGVDFIYKPIDPELLRYKVSVFADLYQKTQELISQEQKLLSANRRLGKEVEERRMSEEKVRLLNEQLLQNNQQLKNTIDELDRFAYVASHDLQEPLRKILIFSDKIRTEHYGKIEPDMERSLERIVTASERMQVLINDLLRFSRQTSMSEEFGTVDLNSVMQDVLWDLNVEEQPDAVVRWQPLPSVWAIKSQMRQLFQNLVSNSLKFRKKDEPPRVQIFAAEVQQSGHQGVVKKYHRIVVEDNGIGFESKFASEIFVVFKRLHSFHEFPGSGVGLSICKKIIDYHNGSISAESNGGNGARFVIDLPMTQLPVAETDEQTMAKAEAVNGK